MVSRPILILILLLCAAPSLAQTLRVATQAPDGTVWMREMRAAAEAVAAGTEGRVRVQYYPGGVMGNDATVLRRMRAGQLQGGAFTASELTTIWPGAQVLGLPFLFRDEDEVGHVRRLVDARLREGFAARGIVLAGIAGGGFVYLMGQRPIERIADLTSAKVWVPQGDRVSELTFRAGGINPVVLSIGDVLTGLQTGLVEVVGNTPSGALAFQWHTRVRHVADLPVAYVTGFLAFDARAVERLREDDRALLLAEIDAAFQRLDAANRRDNEAALETLRRQGLSFSTPDENEVRRWREMGETATRQLLASGDIDAALLAEVQALLEAYRAGRAE